MKKVWKSVGIREGYGKTKCSKKAKPLEKIRKNECRRERNPLWVKWKGECTRKKGLWWKVGGTGSIDLSCFALGDFSTRFTWSK